MWCLTVISATLLIILMRKQTMKKYMYFAGRLHCTLILHLKFDLIIEKDVYLVKRVFC